MSVVDEKMVDSPPSIKSSWLPSFSPVRPSKLRKLEF
jgi:hypothetical protein